MLSVVNKHSSGLGAFFAGAGQDSGEEIDKKKQNGRRNRENFDA